MSPTTYVIGAGPAGLAAAACLTRAGVKHTVVDARDEVAASWKSHYERLHLHTSKRFSALPYAPFPDELPTYPARDQFVDYLDDYARRFDIAPQLGRRVEALTRKGRGYHLQFEDGESVAADTIVVASGYNGVPHRPSFPGQDAFTGTIVHSSEYFSGRDYAAKRVLVVGCGNSGGEIAIDLWEHGAKPLLVVRGPVHVQPRDFLGIPAQEASLRLSRLPIAAADAVARRLGERLYGDLANHGIRRPEKGPIRMLVEDGRVPLIDIGTADLIRQGAIVVTPGIERIEEREVIFADGTRHEIDHIVLATGFSSGLRDWIGVDGALGPRGYPRGCGAENTDANLYFVGFRNPPTGALYDIAREARAVANKIAGD